MWWNNISWGIFHYVIFYALKSIFGWKFGNKIFIEWNSFYNTILNPTKTWLYKNI
jgi:hypothetical protein